MHPTANPSPRQAIAAALGWWRDAGVDLRFEDAPTDFLAREGGAPDTARPATAPDPLRRTAPPNVPPHVPPHVPAPALAEADWPADLARFEAWWLAEPALDQGRTSGRAPPRGPARAPCMIVVEQPEAEDAGRLLSGAQGRLLSGMLAAMGLDEQQCRVASVLPRHMPMPDWREMADRGFGRLLAHHVAIASPARLIVLGANIPPLLGNSLPNRGGILPRFNHRGESMPLFAARGLPALLERPRWKAGFWQGWLDWMRRDPPG